MNTKTETRRLLSRQEAAEAYGIPIRFLESTAAKDNGPARIPIGRRVFYHPDDIELWLDAQRVDTARRPR